MCKDEKTKSKAPASADEEAGDAGQKRDLPAAARRALAEAEERRRKAAADDRAKEVGGRDGPDPVRYGDWEKAGRCIDF